MSITSPTRLDLVDHLNNCVHGSYEAVRNRRAVLNYVKKGGVYITNIKDAVNFKEMLFKICKEKGVDEAMDYFVNMKPELVATDFKSIKSNLTAYVDSLDTDLQIKYNNFDYPENICNSPIGLWKNRRCHYYASTQKWSSIIS